MRTGAWSLPTTTASVLSPQDDDHRLVGVGIGDGDVAFQFGQHGGHLRGDVVAAVDVVEVVCVLHVSIEHHGGGACQVGFLGDITHLTGVAHLVSWGT
jgi:hypothetical protein